MPRLPGITFACHFEFRVQNVVSGGGVVACLIRRVSLGLRLRHLDRGLGSGHTLLTATYEAIHTVGDDLKAILPELTPLQVMHDI